MSYFSQPITHNANRLEAVSNAYRNAGIVAPVPGVGLLSILNTNTASASQVIQKAAKDSLNTDDPAALYKATLKAYSDAVIADQLRADLQAGIKIAAAENINEIVDQAVEDLTPAFEAEVSAFEAAAKQLTYTDVLSTDEAIAWDTTKAYKQAVQSLRNLAGYAGLYPVAQAGEWYAPLLNIIGILELPEGIEVEEVQHITGAISRRLNDTDQFTETLLVRDLTDDLRKDLDSTLIRIARGDYKGVTFSLANVTERGKRQSAAADAHSSQGSNRQYLVKPQVRVSVI